MLEDKVFTEAVNTKDPNLSNAKVWVLIQSIDCKRNEVGLEIYLFPKRWRFIVEQVYKAS